MIIREAKYTSQAGEDGVLESIYNKIGFKSRYLVEFGAASGPSNSTNLIKKHNFSGLLMDGKSSNNRMIKKEFVTAENINLLLKKYNVPEKFDMLSIDIDGNDYWVWKAILDKSLYVPRVVVVEYNCNIPPNKSVSIRYNPDHVYKRNKHYGASFAAFKKLAHKHDYTLVYVTGHLNLFFVHNSELSSGAEGDYEFIYPVNIKKYCSTFKIGLPTWYRANDPETNNEEEWVEV